MAKKKADEKKPAEKKAEAKKPAKRVSWLGDDDVPRIDEMARKLDSFLTAMADGRVTTQELQDQEKRLVKLIKEVEPKLDDELHDKVTQLLCELTAYDLMQTLHSIQEAQPRTKFRG